MPDRCLPSLPDRAGVLLQLLLVGGLIGQLAQSVDHHVDGLDGLLPGGQPHGDGDGHLLQLGGGLGLLQPVAVHPQVVQEVHGVVAHLLGLAFLLHGGHGVVGGVALQDLQELADGLHQIGGGHLLAGGEVRALVGVADDAAGVGEAVAGGAHAAIENHGTVSGARCVGTGHCATGSRAMAYGPAGCPASSRMRARLASPTRCPACRASLPR